MTVRNPRPQMLMILLLAVELCVLDFRRAWSLASALIFENLPARPLWLFRDELAV